MMKNTIGFRFAGIGIMLIMCAVFGVAVMLLWNVLMPEIFGLGQINYLQAAGLLILARLLFGGIGGWQGHAAFQGARAGNERLFNQGNKLREKWMNMSREERKEFFEKEKDFFKFHHRFSHFNGFFGDEEKNDEKKEQGV
jgi:hypothetical protein